MRRLYERVARTLNATLHSHFSDLAEEPAGWEAQLALAAAHRLKPSFVVGHRVFAPYDRVLFVLGRRDIEEVLDRDDVFSALEYEARMKASSGEFFLGMDESAPRYRLERQASDLAVGKTKGRERRQDVSAFQQTDAKRIREIVDTSTRNAITGALDAARRSGRWQIDVAKQLANLVPIALLGEYFGIDEMNGRDGRPQPGLLREHAQCIAFYVFNFFAAGPNYAEPATKAGGRVHDHLLDLSRRERSRPSGRDTVLARMVKNRDAFPTDHDVARTLGGVAIGGVAPGIGSFLHAVARLVELEGDDRAHLEASAKKESAMTVLGFVREGARFAPFPPTIYRTCLEDYTIGVGTVHERRVQKGTVVVPVFLGAAFDRDFVHLPDRFNAMRSDAEYLLFGHGQHQCLGTYLGEYVMARMVHDLFQLPGLCRIKTSSSNDSAEKFAPFGGELVLEFAAP